MDSVLNGSSLLADDATVDLAKEFEASKVQEVVDKLDRELVGLVPIKTRIREIAALLLVERLRRRFGLSAEVRTPEAMVTGR